MVVARTRHGRHRSAPFKWWVGSIVASILAATAVSAQPGESAVPFEAGELLAYRVRVPIFGTVGRATFTVDGPVRYRGDDVLLLRSEITTRWGPVRGTSASSSWFDPERLVSLRFEKDERQPGHRDSEDVTLFPSTGEFVTEAGVRGDMPTNTPLDELSFIYFLRTLDLHADSTLRFTRHYDPARNPVTVRLVRRERVETGIGVEDAWLIEMRVRHPTHYRGEGVIRIHLSADARRIPLRIESSAPATGKVTLVLESYGAAASATAALGR